MLTQLGAFYLDLVQDTAETVRPAFINRNPEPDEIDVLEGGPIRLTVVDVGAAGLNPTKTQIWVDSSAGSVQVWDGTAFEASWAASSTFTAGTSDGGGPNDEHRFVLIRDTDFDSEELVTVRVNAWTNDGEEHNVVYSFAVRDYVEPQIASVATKGLRVLRVEFDELVQQDTGLIGDALRVRTLPSVTLEAPFDLIVNVDTFSTSDVGLFVAIAGAGNPLNNRAGGWQITAVASARRVTLDSAVVDEVLPGSAIATVGPYKLEGVLDPDLVIPVFTPIITGARAGDTADTVFLDLSEELSSGRAYQLEPTQVQDVAGNQLNSTPAVFTSETVKAPPNRRWDMLDMIPQANFNEDTSRDLERLIRCLQDVNLNLLADVDRFGELFDVDRAPDDALDALLAHLGNPFSFVASFTAQEKRRLIDVLVQIYDRNGIEVGMETVINFIVGISVDVRPYLGFPGQWVLGTSQLGVNTLLGPGTQFLKYAFEVVPSVNPTADETRFLNEIVEYMKPAHTHYVRLVLDAWVRELQETITLTEAITAEKNLFDRTLSDELEVEATTTLEFGALTARVFERGATDDLALDADAVGSASAYARNMSDVLGRPEDDVGAAKNLYERVGSDAVGYADAIAAVIL